MWTVLSTSRPLAAGGLDAVRQGHPQLKIPSMAPMASGIPGAPWALVGMPNPRNHGGHVWDFELWLDHHGPGCELSWPPGGCTASAEVACQCCSPAPRAARGRIAGVLRGRGAAWAACGAAGEAACCDIVTSMNRAAQRRKFGSRPGAVLHAVAARRRPGHYPSKTLIPRAGRLCWS